jgi:Cys-tRNA(Pro) deacylase
MAKDTETFRERAREDHGLDIDVQEFPEGTATAEDAAAAIGCNLGQIASSLAFLADQLVVVVTSGANTVDTRTLATLRGVHTAEMADPDDVEEVLGYSVGGVPPFGHDTQVSVYVDETLTEFETVWAAAGSSDAVFPIDPERLVEIADAIVADVVE